jgi:hypothetical protein
MKLDAIIERSREGGLGQLKVEHQVTSSRARGAKGSALARRTLVVATLWSGQERPCSASRQPESSSVRAHGNAGSFTWHE